MITNQLPFSPDGADVQLVRIRTAVAYRDLVSQLDGEAPHLFRVLHPRRNQPSELWVIPPQETLPRGVSVVLNLKPRSGWVDARQHR